MGAGQEGEPYVHRNQLFYERKPDAKKKGPPPQSLMGVPRKGSNMMGRIMSTSLA
jgi:hypothetical protein